MEDSSMPDVRFIIYDGVDEIVTKTELLGIIPWQKIHFSHRFSLYKLRAPFDVKYETDVSIKKHQTVERTKKFTEREISYNTCR